MISGSTRFLIYSLSLLTIVFCQTAEAQTRRPIHVDGSKLETITFSRLIVRPGRGLGISVADDEFSIGVLEEMRRTGYNVVGAENIVFGVDKSSQAKLILGGTIEHGKCNAIAKGWSMVCDMTIQWELFDRGRDEVVYKALTRNRQQATYDREETITRKTAYKMMIGCLRSLFSRQSFVDVVFSASIKSKLPTPATEATYKKCETVLLSLPESMDQVLQATVVVEVGNAVGSGFFLTPYGLIVTAAHLLDGDASVTVKTKEGETLKADVVRVDKENDMAILKIPNYVGHCLSVSKQIPTPGTELYAVGAPAGEDFAFSVSKGVASGMREIDGQQLIQTDASLSPGNSGGPLVNSDGQVVGIVSGKISHTSVEGLGFAVPIISGLEKMKLRPGTSTTLKWETEPARVEPTSELVVAVADQPLEKPYQIYKDWKDARNAAMRKEGRLFRIAAHACFWTGVAGIPVLILQDSADHKVITSVVSLGLMVAAIPFTGIYHLKRQRVYDRFKKNPPRIVLAPTGDMHGAAMVTGWRF